MYADGNPPGCTRKTRILDVTYNASNNELVRTKTLVKSAIVQVTPFSCVFGSYFLNTQTIFFFTLIFHVLALPQVDATPFRQWYVTHYGQELGKSLHPHLSPFCTIILGKPLPSPS